ncbi:MAG: GNAT family N-acetyltransferase [Flavobacteriales bacterium]|nr:GNAT family N-acetyltransferase [Flavobacteriales bacterium]
MNIQLRPWTLSDLSRLVALANNPKIASFLTDEFPYPYEEQHGRKFLDMVTSANPVNVMAITLHGEVVGAIGVHPKSGIERRNAELGYWIGEEYWGRGLGTSAIRQMVNYAFSTFPIHRIFARPFGNNPASQRILEKAGFTLEARFEGTLIKHEVVLDELHYAIRRMK